MLACPGLLYDHEFPLYVVVRNHILQQSWLDLVVEDQVFLLFVSTDYVRLL